MVSLLPSHLIFLFIMSLSANTRKTFCCYGASLNKYLDFFIPNMERHALEHTGFPLIARQSSVLGEV